MISSKDDCRLLELLVNEEKDCAKTSVYLRVTNKQSLLRLIVRDNLLITRFPSRLSLQKSLHVVMRLRNLRFSARKGEREWTKLRESALREKTLTATWGSKWM